MLRRHLLLALRAEPEIEFEQLRLKFPKAKVRELRHELSKLAEEGLVEMLDADRVSFKWKDYRRQGEARYGVMTLDAHEFIRRFLLHVLPDGFHRIRHYGLFANPTRADSIAKARSLLAEAALTTQTAAPEPRTSMTCPCCGGCMILLEVFERGTLPTAWSCAPAPQWCDSS